MNIFPARVSSLILCVFCLFLTACGGGGGKTNSSSGATGNGTSSSASSVVVAGSHNAGQDCTTCHKAGGSGAAKGIFTVAGTIYKAGGTVAQVGATVNLYRHLTSIKNVTLTTDSSGNFYTTQTVADINATSVTGVDVEVVSKTGQVSNMPGVVSSGGCNGCHSPGGGIAKIVALYPDPEF